MSLITKESEVLPFIDQLVESLYTDEINNLLEKMCTTIDDKRTFLMFLMTYFFTHVGTLNSNSLDKKDNLKKFLSEIVLDNDKRLNIINIYKSLEESIETKIKKLN